MRRPADRGHAAVMAQREARRAMEMTLRDYAAPLRRLPVGEIATDDVLAVLKPIWNEKPETASRLRGRIERVLDAAKAQGLRSGENPARWRGHLDQLLPKRQRLTRGHHAAMTYADVPAFMRGSAGPARQWRRWPWNSPSSRPRARARCSARGWDEFDLDRAVWTVPAARMKAGREHRVPLSRAALAIVSGSEHRTAAGRVFPVRSRASPVRDGA